MSWNLLINPIATLLDKVIPDKDAKYKMAHEIATMAENHAHDIAKAQIEVNKQEAVHKSIFVAGWRPFTGWSCSLALTFNFIMLPLINLGLKLAESKIEEIAPLDLTVMLPVLFGMLGLGAMRTSEKNNGVAREK